MAAAFGASMRPDDWTFATYRGHAHTLARGSRWSPSWPSCSGDPPA
ncbi:hypothetical protein ACFQX6_05465 [Streptosporangium lutulentum]